MSRKSIFVSALILWAFGTLALPKLAWADRSLEWAEIQNLRNQVQLIKKNQTPRAARRADKMIPGDALATARASLAELRFNDRSLARVGERAIFRFIPNTRTFQLSNGTMLLLIPPKQGTTRVRTPNAVAGIRGSALFVRYNPETNLTLVGALTNSQIEVFNNDESQNQVLQAGQMAVILNNRIERIYNFDLRTFYETSDLVQGLNLPQRSSNPSEDPAIAAVQAETSEALNAQSPIAAQGSIVNPGFIQLASAQNPQIEPVSASFSPASFGQLPNPTTDPTLSSSISSVLNGWSSDLQRARIGRSGQIEPTLPAGGPGVAVFTVPLSVLSQPAPGAAIPPPTTIPPVPAPAPPPAPAPAPLPPVQTTRPAPAPKPEIPTQKISTPVVVPLPKIELPVQSNSTVQPAAGLPEPAVPVSTVAPAPAPAPISTPVIPPVEVSPAPVVQPPVVETPVVQPPTVETVAPVNPVTPTTP